MPSVSRIDHDEILKALKQYRAEHHISPSLRDLCDLTGVSTTSVMKYHIDQMAARGQVKVTPNISRGIVPVDEMGGCQ